MSDPIREALVCFVTVASRRDEALAALDALVGEVAAKDERIEWHKTKLKEVSDARWAAERKAIEAEREVAALREALQHSEEQRTASARALGRIAGYDPVEHNRHECQPLTPFETVRKIAREALAGVSPAQPAEGNDPLGLDPGIPSTGQEMRDAGDFDSRHPEHPEHPANLAARTEELGEK